MKEKTVEIVKTDGVYRFKVNGIIEPDKGILYLSTRKSPNKTHIWKYDRSVYIHLRNAYVSWRLT